MSAELKLKITEKVSKPLFFLIVKLILKGEENQCEYGFRNLLTLKEFSFYKVLSPWMKIYNSSNVPPRPYFLSQKQLYTFIFRTNQCRIFYYDKAFSKDSYFFLLEIFENVFKRFKNWKELYSYYKKKSWVWKQQICWFLNATKTYVSFNNF